jgi:mRNA-degrading endonuclease RelE of RelBE toxin-antitoxin system
MTYMEIIETKIFTKQITGLLDNEEYREFQNYLCDDPTKGHVIKGTNSLRKIRWKISNKGKSGGIRVIYYWVDSRNTILMLFAYSKSDQSSLTKNQIKILNKIIEEEYNK